MKVALCIKKSEDQDDLVRGKSYMVIDGEDERTKEYGYIRVVDESEEDYLYPEEQFLIVDIPEVA